MYLQYLKYIFVVLSKNCHMFVCKENFHGLVSIVDDSVDSISGRILFVNVYY